MTAEGVPLPASVVPVGSTLERFIARCPSAWHTYVHHPWFEAVARGDLSDERFHAFLVNDRPYIVEFQQAQVRTAALFADLEPWLAAFGLIASETELEEQLLDEVPGARRVRSRYDVCPAREGYMNHIYRATTAGDAAIALASLLPCGVGFGEITRWLGQVDRSEHPQQLRTWIDFYCSEDQQAYSSRLVQLFEDARGFSHSDETEQYASFHRSLLHQIRVFDAAWSLDDAW